MTLYFVGTKQGHKRNSYVAVTNCRKNAEYIAAASPKLSVCKEKKV
jgi:hypothetical protein